MENWEMAILDYQKSAKLNPYHYSTHYKLAEIAKKEGQYTKAMLCYNSYLLLHAKDNLEFLASYNSFLSTDYNPEPVGIQLSTDDYSDIDELISSKIALDKKYKTPNKLTQPIVKQNYLLLEQLNQRDLGDGFWDSFYVPFFIQLLKDEKFNDYIYFSMQSATNKSVVKVLESNYKKTQAFPDYAGGWWQSLHSDNIEMYNGKVQKVHYYWLNINTVQAIGTVIDGEPVGQFTYYSNVGSVSAIAFFDEDGERTKTWQYFHKNGVKSGSEPYEDGDLHGNDSAFYDNGQIKSVVSYVEGKAQGMASYWNKRGTKSRTITYTDNDLTGAAQYFYKTGLLHYKINYVNGDFTDDFLAFHGNGQLAEKRHYIDNAKSGANTYYYNNGQQSSEANYTEGELNGPFKNWFKDGSLKSEGEYMDNTIIKLKRTYNANGTMATEEIYDEDGKLNGEYKEYDEAGNLNLVLTFKKSDLVAYKVYHRNGSIIKEAKKKGGQFLFENYYSDGTKKAVGTYLPGKNGKTGTWKFYTWNGVLDSESTYENGLIIGEAKDYYASG
jgi:antitoxin component YwqK of YwqJK toxin-antitoxin module